MKPLDMMAPEEIAGQLVHNDREKELAHELLRRIRNQDEAIAKLHGALTRIRTMPVSERKWSTAMDIAGTALGIDRN